MLPRGLKEGERFPEVTEGLLGSVWGDLVGNLPKAGICDQLTMGFDAGLYRLD